MLFYHALKKKLGKNCLLLFKLIFSTPNEALIEAIIVIIAIKKLLLTFIVANIFSKLSSMFSS
jgi:hypothetical protein